jgi:hypothetical protein
VISFLMGKYLKASRSVDGLRGDRRWLVLPAGHVRLNFGLISGGQSSPRFFSGMRSSSRMSSRTPSFGILS